MRRLPEVHMRDTIVAHIVVLDKAELGVRCDSLHQLSSSIDICLPLEKAERRIRFGGHGVAVFRHRLRAVFVEIYRSAPDAGLPLVMRWMRADG